VSVHAPREQDILSSSPKEKANKKQTADAVCFFIGYPNAPRAFLDIEPRTLPTLTIFFIL
jgi:hypothetical protein